MALESSNLGVFHAGGASFWYLSSFQLPKTCYQCETVNPRCCLSFSDSQRLPLLVIPQLLSRSLLFPHSPLTLSVSQSASGYNFDRQLQVVADVQQVFEDDQAILKVLPHLSKNHDQLVKEILSFMAALLYGGNTQVKSSAVTNQLLLVCI